MYGETFPSKEGHPSQQQQFHMWYNNMASAAALAASGQSPLAHVPAQTHMSHPADGSSAPTPSVGAMAVTSGAHFPTQGIPTPVATPMASEAHFLSQFPTVTTGVTAPTSSTQTESLLMSALVAPATTPLGHQAAAMMSMGTAAFLGKHPWPSPPSFETSQTPVEADHDALLAELLAPLQTPPAHASATALATANAKADAARDVAHPKPSKLVSGMPSLSIETKLKPGTLFGMPDLASAGLSQSFGDLPHPASHLASPPTTHQTSMAHTQELAAVHDHEYYPTSSTVPPPATASMSSHSLLFRPHSAHPALAGDRSGETTAPIKTSPLGADLANHMRQTMPVTSSPYTDDLPYMRMSTPQPGTPQPESPMAASPMVSSPMTADPFSIASVAAAAAAAAYSPMTPTTGSDGKRTHFCPYPGCGRGFPRFYNLKSHLLCHTGARPHVCPHCRAAFARKHDLQRHSRTLHSGRRPFTCMRCSQGFNRLDAYQRHLGEPHDPSLPPVPGDMTGIPSMPGMSSDEVLNNAASTAMALGLMPNGAIKAGF